MLNHPESARNARVTLAIFFLSELSFVLPVWLIFGRNELGLSTLATTALFMTIWIGSGLLDIPTGAFADRFGRKKMFIIGSLLLITYPVAFMLRAPFPVLFGVGVITAFGSALQSGTLTAMTHASFKKEKRSDKDYHAFLSNIKICEFSARACSGIAGGFLYAQNPIYPFAALSIVYAVVLLMGFLTIDTDHERSTLSNRLHIMQTLQYFRSSTILMSIAGIYILSQLVAEAVWTGLQLFFEHAELTSVAIGTMFTVIALISAMGAFFTRFYMRRIGVLTFETTLMISFLLATLMIVSDIKVLLLLSIIPLAAAFGCVFLPITAITQQKIPQKYHSTALSALSVMQTTVYGIASLLVGFFIDSFGLQTTKQILAVQALIATIIIFVIFVKYRYADEVASSPV